MSICSTASECLETSWRKDWKGQAEFSNGTSSARGVAILISGSIDLIINKVVKDNTGRFLLLDTTFEGQQLILVNIYAPTKDDKSLQCEFLDFVHETLQRYSDKNLFIGGDFNTCIDPNIDKKGGTFEKPSKTSEKLLSFMDDYNLIDVWRFLNNDSRRFTRRLSPV